MATQTQNTNNSGKNGKAGKWTANGFVPAKSEKKSISLLAILLGKK